MKATTKDTPKTTGSGEWGIPQGETPEKALEKVRAEKNEIVLRLQMLEQQEKALAEAERAQNVELLSIAIHEAGVDLADIAAFFTKKGWVSSSLKSRPVAKKKPAPPKYRNPETGETHSGRGQLPDWLRRARDAGTMEDYRIK